MMIDVHVNVCAFVCCVCIAMCVLRYACFPAVHPTIYEGRLAAQNNSAVFGRRLFLKGDLATLAGSQRSGQALRESGQPVIIWLGFC